MFKTSERTCGIYSAHKISKACHIDRLGIQILIKSEIPLIPISMRVQFKT